MAEKIPVLQEDGSVREESFDEAAQYADRAKEILSEPTGAKLGEPLRSPSGITLHRLAPAEQPKLDQEK